MCSLIQQSIFRRYRHPTVSSVAPFSNLRGHIAASALFLADQQLFGGKSSTSSAWREAGTPTHTLEALVTAWDILLVWSPTIGLLHLHSFSGWSLLQSLQTDPTKEFTNSRGVVPTSLQNPWGYCVWSRAPIHLLGIVCFLPTIRSVSESDIWVPPSVHPPDWAEVSGDWEIPAVTAGADSFHGPSMLKTP